MTRKMKEIVSRRLKIYRHKAVEYAAHIGNISTGEVAVTGKRNTVYVTLQTTGKVLEAVNKGGGLAVLGTPVIVGYEAENPNQLVILRGWNAFGNVENPTDGVKNHHQQHQWRNGSEAGGDIVYVWGEQILPMLYKPSGLNVIIYPGAYRTSTGWARKKKRTTINLTSHVPSGSGEARYVLIVVNSSGAFAVRDGADVSGYDNLADADIPEPTAGDNVICAVKLYYGQTALRHTPAITDFVDLRWAGANNGSTSSLPIHGIEHIETGDDPIPDVVSGGADGLMTGADKAKLDNYNTYPYYMVTEDLTAQITGAATHFDISTAARSAIHVYNTLRQRPMDVTIDADQLGFTLSYTPTLSDTMVVDFFAPANKILFDTVSGLPLTDDYGNLLEA